MEKLSDYLDSEVASIMANIAAWRRESKVQSSFPMVGDGSLAMLHRGDV